MPLAKPVTVWQLYDVTVNNKTMHVFVLQTIYNQPDHQTAWTFAASNSMLNDLV